MNKDFQYLPHEFTLRLGQHLPLLKISCRSLTLCVTLHTDRLTDWQANRPDRITCALAELKIAGLTLCAVSLWFDLSSRNGFFMHNLYIADWQTWGYLFVADRVDLFSSFTFKQQRPKMRKYWNKLRVTAVQGYSRSSQLVPIDNPYVTSY